MLRITVTKTAIAECLLEERRGEERREKERGEERRVGGEIHLNEREKRGVSISS